MVNFVRNVYAKAWISIKTKPLFTDSPTHLFNMIQNTVQLDDSRVTEVMFRVIENNSFAVHSENLLCAMLADSIFNIRRQAIKKIRDIRKTFRAWDFRKFIKPSNINFQANDYYELIGEDIWLESILTGTRPIIMNQYSIHRSSGAIQFPEISVSYSHSSHSPCFWDLFYDCWSETPGFQNRYYFGREKAYA